MTVEEVELEPPRDGEVLVRVVAAGVCHSDLHLANGALGDGRWPMVLGHEGAGIVEEVGEGVTHVAPGDRVALCFVPSCRACRSCRAGRPEPLRARGGTASRGTLMDGTSRLRARRRHAASSTGCMTACFAERDGRLGRRRRAAAATACRSGRRRSSAARV